MTISNLYIYPIKSLGGIAVTEAIVDEKGFRHDRRFMLVSPGGQFMTQRTNHQMALIDVSIQNETLHVWHRHQPGNVLKLPLTVPTTTSTSAHSATVPVTIWDSENVSAVPVSDVADQWFSGVLGVPCRLVFMPDTTRRDVEPDYVPNPDFGRLPIVSFADGYPYLVIGQASLDDLNRRMEQPLEMRRFRPNIVVSGSSPFDEDAWFTFRMGDVDFYGVKPCARCVLTTINPNTGEKGREPLKTLTTYRQWNHKILFGQNVLANPATIGSVVRVGESITVLSRRQPRLSPPVSVIAE